VAATNIFPFVVSYIFKIVLILNQPNDSIQKLKTWSSFWSK